MSQIFQHFSILLAQPAEAVLARASTSVATAMALLLAACRVVCAAARPKLTVAKLPQSLMMVAWPGHGLRMGFIWIYMELYGIYMDIYGCSKPYMLIISSQEWQFTLEMADEIGRDILIRNMMIIQRWPIFRQIAGDHKLLQLF